MWIGCVIQKNSVSEYFVKMLFVTNSIACFLCSRCSRTLLDIKINRILSFCFLNVLLYFILKHEQNNDFKSDIIPQVLAGRLNKTTEFSSHCEGYHLFGVKISIVNHSNSYVDFLFFVFPALKGNQIIKSIKHST